MKNIKDKKTPIGKSYWNNNGAYQKEYNKLNEKLVPASGDAETVNGELIRAIGRLFYEFCNNGNCNSVKKEYEEQRCYDCNGDGYHDDEQECWGCGGNGYTEETGESTITDYYQAMVDFISSESDCTSIYDLEEFMKEGPGYSNYSYDDKEMDIYNRVCDEVIYYVLTNKDQPNPKYTKD